MDALCQDARLAFRSLRKAPAFSGAAIATIALGIGATTAIFSAMNAAHVVSESLSRQRLGMLLMFILGLAAIALAGIGVYGVIAYSVAQRVREVAIRMALGATPAEVFRLTVVRAQVIAVAGVLGGLVLAYSAGRILAGLLYEVRAGDPVILASSTALVAVVALLATVLPARRAARVDPIRDPQSRVSPGRTSSASMDACATRWGAERG